MGDIGSEGREHVIGAAKRLFAGLGYDQTTSEMIARSAGVSAGFVNGECGGKQQIYRDIFRNIDIQAQDVRSSLLMESDRPGRERLHRLLDELFRYFEQDREAAAIWRQRSMGDAADLSDIEEDFAKPAFENVISVTGDAFRDDVDVELMMGTIIAATDSFFNGMIVPLGVSGDEPDPAEIARFRRHIYALVEPFLRSAER
jgi:AcrR family transcriptional regulator